MTMPQVINVRKAELEKRTYSNFTAWNQTEGNVYIGRNMNYYVKGAHASKWANPFTVKKYGLEESLKLYEEHVKKNLLHEIHELKHVKELGCWCKPAACHGDILLKLLHDCS